MGHPSVHPASLLCPGAPTRLPACGRPAAGEGCSCWAVAQSCTWIPEVLGNPVQTWVVMGEHGADSSTPRPDQTTQPSRMNHFEVMGFRGCGRLREPTWREWAGHAGLSHLASGQLLPSEGEGSQSPRGQGYGLGGQREAGFKCPFLAV